ncbi:bacteriohemerythrin [Methylomonas sp. EFPC1]|uniref:bacteriohemerythrin n=1 Tax=unclassified Methylomonas TaxID=2608980 RepID=UPI000C32E1E7|nr:MULTISPECIES: bacteriohemerythrin [unclassified Methylomonas]PKD42201.1 histidine kinase [Methylomonas sp. Kb3]QSB02859.1 bacteriohemerythrin [Methylomonas sp. EFPC1]
MSILTWNDQLLVGIESVDNQHRHLVALINRLDELNALGADLQTVLETVKQLVEYTVEHFQHEEQLMMEAGFNPRMQDQHCQQHQEFIDKMQQVHVEAQSDVSVISKDLLDFLVDWLCHHILKTDKLMAISLNQGIDAEQVSIDKDEHVDILHSNLYSALRESEERFKELADHLPALIWITNAKNLPIFCNRFWFKTFRIERGFVDRRQWLNTIHPDDRDKVVQTYQQAAQELTKFKIQYRLCTEDAKEVWILETAVPRMRKNGKFAGLMGCGMDISTQKQAETALLKLNQQLEERVRERTQALTEANQTLQMEKNQQTLLNQKLQETQAHLVQSEKMASIGQLAAGVAHEINNPLGYIYSNLNSLKQYIQELIKAAELAERLAGQLADNHPDVQAFKQFKNTVDLDFLKDDAADLVEESLEGATRAKKIVQDLRDFSRIDKQGREMFDLEAGIDATLNIVNNELKYKAEVVKEYGGIKPFECVGAQLNQVFMNLLVNAAQAIEDFGKITVRTGYQDADWVWVDVEDNGQGMSEATRMRIFDPFFTTKPVGKGTGLGLSLSYKIIQDHHGRIEIDSEIGRGTRFRIYLPTRTPAS